MLIFLNCYSLFRAQPVSHHLCTHVFSLSAWVDKTGSKHRSSDIISLLVSIYGSKQIFIDEYRTVLADRLLQQLNYSTARYRCTRIPLSNPKP